jgi:hypothetical protein
MSSQFILSLLLLLFRNVFAVSDQNSLFRSDEYAHGKFGIFPVQTFRSSDVQGPLLNYWSQSRACNDGKYTLLTPRGSSVNQSGPAIVDQDGNLIWFKEYGHSYNANIYQFRNESYLTFWSGKESFGGRGDGTVYMVRPLRRSVGQSGKNTDSDIRSTSTMRRHTRSTVPTAFPLICTSSTSPAMTRLC